MQKLRLSLIICLLFVLSGCGTARIRQFNQFAQAGRAYANAVAVLTEEAGDAAIDADSIALIKYRDVIPAAERSSTVIEHNRSLKETLQLLRDVRRHAMVLKSYFAALSSLAQTDVPSGIGTASEGLVDSLGTISERIKNAKVAEAGISEFTGSVAKMTVGQFQRAALEKELKKRAPIIERELDIQQAALQLIAAEMKIDLQAVIVNSETVEIVSKYKANKPLPPNWSKRRRQILRANASLTSLDAAADAAKNLKVSFVALVENRFQLSDVDSLIRDINEILTLVETMKGEQEKQ